jgi:hypothetical protein
MAIISVMALPAPNLKTLQEWRSQKLERAYPRTVWIPLESFFLSHGYTLWNPSTSLHPYPPNDAPRTPDGFAYRTVYCEIKPNVRQFDMIVSSQTFIICFLKSDSLRVLL